MAGTISVKVPGHTRKGGVKVKGYSYTRKAPKKSGRKRKATRSLLGSKAHLSYLKNRTGKLKNRKRRSAKTTATLKALTRTHNRYKR